MSRLILAFSFFLICCTGAQACNARFGFTFSQVSTGTMAAVSGVPCAA